MTKENLDTKPVKFEVKIDNTTVTVTDSSLSILEVARGAGFDIPAPCFDDKRKYGGCKACVVEIDEKQSYACRRKPKKGMHIVVDREDLNQLREERIIEYKKKVDIKTKKN
ncbi:2Fe-2S iron-sulfur cluster-binding protein [Ancylomarina sp. 16SWW S1-10-2]|uniref:2Fe-2S iron-sulfur cluster-binding protein n=1 Tax=Ancylomarina sp. 16SWW S1-10-2 TaxID=2499681 RepID=UPI0012AE2F52|nr:2Fe-2S iron-sulfur cluster-binding protein [Ancylomarina sp. 16SWW S1-10-2]MRT92690.1 2Fe-2S iron-sulfur cluster binding domain-containing protein [Ancylomarina sp. 16SWW S1-10-2]